MNDYDSFIVAHDIKEMRNNDMPAINIRIGQPSMLAANIALHDTAISHGRTAGSIMNAPSGHDGGRYERNAAF